MHRSPMLLLGYKGYVTELIYHCWWVDLILMKGSSNTHKSLTPYKSSHCFNMVFTTTLAGQRP